MMIHLKSKVFDITFKFNKTLVVAQLSIILCLAVLLMTSQSVTLTIVLSMLLLLDTVIVVLLLFNDFKYSCDGDIPKSKQPANNRKKEKSTSSTPVMKLDIPVPEVEQPATEFIEPQITLPQPEPSEPQFTLPRPQIPPTSGVTVSADWKNNLI